MKGLFFSVILKEVVLTNDIRFLVTVQNRTAYLLRCPYEDVKITRASPIAAGNFHGLVGVSGCKSYPDWTGRAECNNIWNHHQFIVLYKTKWRNH